MSTHVVDTAATDSDGETRVTWDDDGTVGLLVIDQAGDDAYAHLTVKQAHELAKWLTYAAGEAEGAEDKT